MIYVDFETRSKCDLIKEGAWKYSLHPSTEVLCMAWAIDDGEVQLWKAGDPIPKVFLGYNHVIHGVNGREEVISPLCEAHNAFFELAIWTNVLKWPAVKWCCSAAKCAAHSLPRSLDKAGKALGLSIQKDQEGKRVMMKMCKPRKPTKHNPAIWHERPEDFQKLYAYCMDDVRAERALGHALRDLSAQETKVWELDQKINVRGVRVDVDAVQAALDLSEEYTERLNEEMFAATNGEVLRASEAGKLTKWCNSMGVAMNSVAKQELADALNNMEMPEEVRTALTIRQRAAKTSVAKYKAMKAATAPDGRIRDLLMYHGASTGRWTGKLVQPQNLPRNNFKGDLEQYFTILKTATPSAFELCFPEVMETISSLIRPCFIASEGKALFGGDYSSIEARVLLWLAGDERALDLFRHGKDVYLDLASEIYNMRPEDIAKDSRERQLGKQGILGCGYGMGHAKFLTTCEAYGIEIDEEMAQKVVDTYRNKYHKVKSMWYDMERAAISAVETGDMQFCGKIGWGIDGDFLYAKLPSKRLIAYYKPEVRMTETPWGQEKNTLTYMATNSVTRKWERERTYGGKIVENITQGVARDVMAEAMLRCEDAGYEVVLTVHDEILTEKGDGNVKEFENLMSALPDWAEGLPVEVEGWSGQRYLK